MPADYFTSARRFAGRASPGALRAGPSAGRQNKNTGAGPRRLHFDAGPGRRRRQRQLRGAGDGDGAAGSAVTRCGAASGAGRRRGRGPPCLDAVPAGEPTRVRAVTGTGLPLPAAEEPPGPAVRVPGAAGSPPGEGRAPGSLCPRRRGPPPPPGRPGDGQRGAAAVPAAEPPPGAGGPLPAPREGAQPHRVRGRGEGPAGRGSAGPGELCLEAERLAL